MLGISNVAPKGEVPMTVKLAYYIAAAVLLIASIWTVISVREYEPKTYIIIIMESMRTIEIIN